MDLPGRVSLVLSAFQMGFWSDGSTRAEMVTWRAFERRDCSASFGFGLPVLGLGLQRGQSQEERGEGDAPHHHVLSLGNSVALPMRGSPTGRRRTFLGRRMTSSRDVSSAPTDFSSVSSSEMGAEICISVPPGGRLGYPHEPDVGP